MVKYVICREGRLYVTPNHPFVNGTWTNSIYGARLFKTKRDATAYLASLDIPSDECEVVATGSVHNDARLELISEVPELRSLWVCSLRRTSSFDPLLTDKGLATLAKIANLEELGISGECFTDSGLEHLMELTRLRRLRIVHTRVTEEGVKKLQQALPECQIDRK